jgi:amino acid adenylation domain-containing protein
MEETFTRVINILYLAKQDEVEIILNDGRLQLKVPESKTINPTLLEEIRSNKDSIINFLSNENLQLKKVNLQNKITCTDPKDRPSQIPLSYSQERLWFIDHLEGSLQYHVTTVLRLTGKLNLTALEFALAQIVNRHEVLRTVYVEEGGQAYQVVKAINNWTLEIVNGNEYQNDPEGLKNYIAEEGRKPFNLSKDDMLRAKAIKLKEDEYVVILMMHHIASDAWSTPILVNEVAELYESYIQNRPSALATLPLQFSDYVLWQRKYLQGEVLTEKLSYWKEKLDGVSTLDLPTDYTRPLKISSRGSSVGFVIPPEIASGLRKLSQTHGCTLYMTLLAAFKVLLYRYSGQEDICVGTSIAGRPQKELEGLIGFFVNTLALRDEVRGEMTFQELLGEVRNTMLGAYGHQEVPFDKIVESVVKERDPGRSPLFQVMLVLINTPEVPKLQLGELVLKGEPYENSTVKFESTFILNETGQGIRGSVLYSTDLYKRERIERMIGHFTTLLKSIVESPVQKVGLLDILDAEEKQHLIEKINTSHVNSPNTSSVLQLFEEQVVQSPDATALVFERRQFTYFEIDSRSNQLAHYLQSKGVKNNSLVPLYIERGVEMIIGILGILKAGGAYVPVDIDFPAQRVDFILTDTRASLVVSSQAGRQKLGLNTNLEIVELDFEESLVNTFPQTTLSNIISPDQLAYVIYTSGSTGNPKGVLITHNNLTDYILGLNERISINSCSSYAMLSSIATDLGNTVLLSWMVSGGTLHIFSKDAASHIENLHQYFKRHKIDCIKIVPSHWKALSLDNVPLLPEKMLVFGGEALQAEYVRMIRDAQTSCRVINHYGPTETTVGKLVYELDLNEEHESVIPIGKPFSDTHIYVVSTDLALSPIGVPGELYIGGAGVAKSYLNNQQLTEEKFIKNPFNPDSSTCLYKTGDLVKYLSDGNIQFLGRVDDQVKIRGYRVELGEIESVIQESDLVKQAVVLGLDDKQGNKRLVAYVVGEQTFNREELLDYLREKLPDYMVPSVLVELESLPLAPNGKVDRKNLPNPDETEQKSDEYIAPRNATETQLAEIWQHVLEVDQVGINDDFFELGGHSLLAVRLISAIRKAFKAELPISDVFDYPTIAGQASQIELQLGAGKTAAELLPAISVNSRPLRIPLSYSQERLWFIDRLEGSLQYHVPTVLQLSGKLNIEALSSAIREVISRHEVLRTVIREEDGQAWQEIRGVKENILTLLDGNTIQPGELDSYIKQIIRKPFNLSEDMMLRAHLISLEPDEHVLVVTLHHIASDGWSRSILVSELVELYSSFTDQRKALLPPLPVQYADFALWQRSYLEGGVLQKKLNYWNEKLRNVSPLELPTDHTRPAVQGTQGSIIYFSIGAEVADSLQKLSQLHGATLYMTLLSAFKILLYRYSRQEDICVGSPIAGRQQQELEGLIGFFVNTLAMRSHLDSEMRFTELLEAVKNTTLEAYANQEIPFEKVVETVGNARDLSRNPLFQVMFILRNTPDVPELRLGDVALSRAAHEHTTSLFDLSLYLTETEFGLKGSLEYNTQLYEEATIERMIVHFKELLNSIIARPTEKIGSVKILSQLEEEALINFNVTDTVYPADTTLVKLFEQQVIDGNAIEAVVFGDSKLTYGELNIQANQLAHFLIQNGLEPGGLVPLCIERSLNMIIGILGILKAGGVYVPIDPEYPLERIRFMLEDTEATLILSSIASRSKLGDTSFAKVIEVDGAHSETISAKPVANPQISARDEQLVYVIYTSGSTGKPKGVQMPEKGMINLLYWQEQQFVNQHRHVLQFASITFDVSFQEIFSTLCFGSTLYLIEENRRKDMAAMLEDIARYKISHLFIPYIVLKSLVETAGTLTNLSTLPEEIIVAGEQLKLTDDIRAMITRAGVKLVNQYGPTEAHVVSCYRLEGESLPALPPIGKPIANTKLYVVDGQGALCPIGIPGELYIGGVQVAKGYLNREELSSQKFVIDTFSAVEGARLYKTGDLARWLSDGNIEYLGRIDDQVKVRGYRIELGEIESVLQQSRLVRQGVILDSEDSNGNKRLVGYAVAENNRIFDKDAVIEYLKNRLPEYMVPTLWVELDSMPITANGKVDKRALPAPDLSQLGSREYTAPSTEMEHKLAAIWQELLGVERISVHDNFFELGGHSLMAMKVVSQIKNKLSLTVPIQSIFQFPSIYELSNYLEMSEDEDTASFEEIII